MAEDCSVRVVCRYRPHNEIENAKGGHQVCTFPAKDSVKQNGRTYNFDRVFDTSTTQRQLYVEAARPIVEDVLKGCNGTMFAYGQTSSGKTHTMEGVLGDTELCGVIPRIVEDIFNYIQQMDPGEAAENFFIKVSYFEVYMEKIRDLLNTSKTNLSIHEDKNRSTYVKDLTERYVATPEEVFDIIQEGKENRHVSATNMNLHSSRSHSILQISVRQSFGADKRNLNGKLYLVDLAGSEKVGKTGASGVTLDEAKMINKSLAALGNVISALTEAKGRSHIPYRDSKLTRILQESLGGNSKTTMVICCSPSSFNDAETKSTLDFGKRAKSIKNVVCVNEELTAEEWKRRYEKEKEKTQKMKNVMAALQKEVQRWRNGESVSASDQVNLSKPLAAESSVPLTTAETAAAASGGMLSTASMGMMSPSSLSDTSAVKAGERAQFEAERAKLYSDMDDKDGELNTLGQEVERLRMANTDLQELLDLSGKECEERLTNLNRCQQESEQHAEQVKEVLKALEDMALNYESKNQELDEKNDELERLKERADTMQAELQQFDISVSKLRDDHSGVQTSLQDALNGWYDSLSSLATDVECNVSSYQRPSMEAAEESMASLRLLENNVRSSLRSAVRRSESLEGSLRSTENELATRLEDISNWKLRVSQYEADATCYEQNIVELQSSNQSLQSSLDNLSRELASVTAAANAQAAQKGGSKPNAEKSRQIEQQVHLLEKQHSEQLAAIRAEMDRKQSELTSANTSIRHQELEAKHLQGEMLELRQIQRDNMEKIAELTLEKASKSKADEDTQALRSAVEREAERLAVIKKAFVATVKSEMGNGDSTTTTTNSAGTASSAHLQKLAFLESNLQQLTQAHKQLIQSHNMLQREYSKQDARIKAKSERINTLETIIANIKANYTVKKQKLAQELENIRKSYEAKVKRGGVLNRSTIVKAVRPGQAITSSAATAPSAATAATASAGASAAVSGGGGGGSMSRPSQLLSQDNSRQSATTPRHNAHAVRRQDSKTDDSLARHTSAASAAASDSTTTTPALLSPGALATRSLRGEFPVPQTLVDSNYSPVTRRSADNAVVGQSASPSMRGSQGNPGQSSSRRHHRSSGSAAGDADVHLSARRQPVGVDSSDSMAAGLSATSSMTSSAARSMPNEHSKHRRHRGNYVDKDKVIIVDASTQNIGEDV